MTLHSDSLADAPSRARSTHDVNALPPLTRAIPLGLQHVLAMFVANVTVPIIIAGAADLPAEQTAFMIQAAMFVAGAATLLQSLGLGPIGARLPIVMGTSFGFVPVLIPIAVGMGLPAALGAGLCGGIAMALVGSCLRWVRFLFRSALPTWVAASALKTSAPRITCCWRPWCYW